MAALLTRIDITIPDDAKNVPYSDWLKLLSPRGQLNLTVSESTSQKIMRDLLMAGFVDSVSTTSDSNQCLITTSKPSWEMGTSAKIKKAPAAAGSTRVVIPLADDEDLVNEDDLLDELPEISKDAASDCSKKKRACKDCSCGRAEIEAEADATGKEAPPKSACGNCYKGDAFRCAGCPMLGKPAFDPNQENVQLNLTDDIDI
eukprot:CAMPEP_0114361014 /NCGR_PEP_ID=MMETSP0101-20121206/24333_1 /TAXON_ID=38822 ORGANISM="Pteridomonas danica, Strain PT" /NCGR_SAMPLE_ID=MMETSP0101 /ASSEMBLY_ACC=CAM_ASM_000211 /LENGTH=201 /DNA_ID=CAMNT_0001505613 /DNA_START=28 /DNA_END=633 /DNA_ORIENTATION=-